MYRMHQAQVLVGEDGLELAWTNNADEVGLMGLLLVPEPTPQTPTQQALFEQLSVAGRYPVEASLTPLVEATQAAYERDPNDVFAAYWREQVHTLAKAERYLEDLRGWEWASDSTGLSIFQRYHQIVMWLDGILAHADPENFPLYERAWTCLTTAMHGLLWPMRPRGPSGSARCSAACAASPTGG